MTRPSWRIEVLETTGSRYRDLEAVGRALGFEPARGFTTRFKLNTTVCEASLEINSGTVVGATFSVQFEGPVAPLGPTMVLRRETFRDIEDKHAQVSAEAQVGDEQFDFEVYVDTNAADPEVKRFLNRAEARQAARWLINHGVDKLRVERDGVHATVKKSPEQMEDDLHGIYEKLLVLARAGPLRGVSLAQRGEWVAPVSALAGAVSVGAVFVAVALNDAIIAVCGDLVVGAAVGFGTSRLIGPLVQRAVSGHSASGQRARIATISLSVAAGCLTAAVVVALVTLKFR